MAPECREIQSDTLSINDTGGVVKGLRGLSCHPYTRVCYIHAVPYDTGYHIYLRCRVIPKAASRGRIRAYVALEFYAAP